MDYPKCDKCDATATMLARNVAVYPDTSGGVPTNSCRPGKKRAGCALHPVRGVEVQFERDPGEGWEK